MTQISEPNSPKEKENNLSAENGFNDWANRYDQDIWTGKKKGYPFEGYFDTLRYIQQEVILGKAKTVLDIGIGTGMLSQVLYLNGIQITGIDFSKKMLDMAKAKMPNAQLVQFDFNKGLPSIIETEQFDFIVSSYAFHHIHDIRKINLFKKLIRNLKAKGTMLIGDIAFKTKRDMQIVKEQSPDWDDAEYYFVAEKIIRDLALHELRAKFVKISSCSGVLEIRK